MSRPTLVIGDVHGCADELRALLELAGKVRVVSVGDLFTKGPDPVGTWEIIKAHKIKAVLGNHEVRLLASCDGQRPNDRHAALVAKALGKNDPSWLPWVRKLPLSRAVGPFIVTHAALHPSGKLSKTDRYTHIFRRRWPGDNASDCPVWWEAYHGPPVIFGHDAKRGLVLRERKGKPWVVGLDSGCVYGGQLSGWLVEEGRLLQVTAKKTYQAV